MLSIATSYATSYQQAQVTHGWHWDAISLQYPEALINPAAAGFLQPVVCSYLSVLAG